MNNEDKLKALNWWQTCDFFHEFTCSNNPSLKHEHAKCAMIPVEVDGKVYLRCPICNRLQSHALDEKTKAKMYLTHYNDNCSLDWERCNQEAKDNGFLGFLKQREAIEI